MSSLHLGGYAALLAQAERQPQAEALRCKRRGAWWVHSWSRLAADARSAAQGWAALGVGAGDTIAVLGPLGAPLIVTLFAADALGATVTVASADDEAALVRGARFALADGSHDLERALRHRGPRLEAVVVGDGDAAVGAASSSGLTVIGIDALFERGRQIVLPPGTPSAAPTAHADVGPHARVFADFDPGWRDGLDFIARAWPAAAPVLLIPEPGGDATVDRREARASLWLAPAQRLAAFEQQFADRAPSTGLAAAALRSVRRGSRGPIGRLLRSRLAANLGVGTVRQVHSDADVPEAAHALLRSLGVAVAPAASSNVVPLAHAVSQPAVPRFDGALAGSAS